MIISKHKKALKISLIVVIVILLFLIIIAVVSRKKTNTQQDISGGEVQKTKQYTSINDFENIQEVTSYLNCKFIKQQNSNIDGISYEIYVELPVKINDSKEDYNTYTENLIQYMAYILEYKNFYIFDEEKGIEILVYCNEEQKLIEKYFINGVENYFQAQVDKQNIMNFQNIESIDLEVTSKELQQIIAKGWKIGNNELGTIESTYRNYNIYFDEGFEIRNVNGKVFNIVFNEKYQGSVINNLTTKSSLEEVTTALGKPSFESGNLIGYKGKNLYVFFYENQISIYRVEEYETENIGEIIKKFVSAELGEEDFVKQVKNVWPDYDIYEYGTSSVKLQYTLKGLCIKFDSTNQKGVVLYNNYKGNAYGNSTLEDIIKKNEELPNGIHVENEDLIFKAEKNRVNTLDDTSANNNYSSNVVMNTSNKFKTHCTLFSSLDNTYNVKFISINKEYPNSEFREAISTGIWYDDYIFIYSKKNIGIYAYNLQTKETHTILKGSNEYNIKNIRDNILFYDDNAVQINL